MVIFLGILFLIFDLLMITYLIIRMKRCENLSLKDTFIYPFFILNSIGIIFVGSFIYSNDGTPWYSVLSNSFVKALDLVKLVMDTTLIKVLFDKNKILFIDYLLSYLIGLMALLSIALSLLKVSVVNFFRNARFQEEVNYIFELNDNSKKYLHNLDKEQRKKSIVLLKRIPGKDLKEEKIYLYLNKIKYIVVNYDSFDSFDKLLNKLTKNWKKQKYYFLSFIQNDHELCDFIEFAQAYLKKYNLYEKDYKFIVYSSPHQNYFIKELIKGNPYGEEAKINNKLVKIVDESRGAIRSFDKYELMAFDFIQEHNFAKHFPAALKNDNGTIVDCDINLYVIGFGKVNQALLKDILIQNQFVTIKNKKLTPVRINVNVYDEKDKFNNLTLSSGILKYNINDFLPFKDEYFALPEDYYHHVHFKYAKCTGECDFLNDLKRIHLHEKKEKRQVNFFLISVGSDFENSLVVQKIYDMFNFISDDTYNRAFVRTKDGISLPCFDFITKSDDQFDIIPFGDDNMLLNYDNVIRNNLYEKAMRESCVYQHLDLTKENITLLWASLSRIKQRSNLYSIASIAFKMSLLNFNQDYSLEEYFAKYDPDGARDHYQYSTKLITENEVYTPRDVLAFIEHERWNAFQLSEGVLPFKKKNLFDAKNQKLHTKSSNELFHINLTSQEGLYEYHDYIDQLNEQYQTNFDNDVVKYDYDLMDHLIK